MRKRSLTTLVMVLILACVTTARATVTLNTDGLCKALRSDQPKQNEDCWNHKDHTAVEYKSGGSNYRTYKPTSSPTADGGLLVSTKVDYIRGGAKDDHVIIKMKFDSNGKIVEAEAEMVVVGKKEGTNSLKTGIITAAALGVDPATLTVAAVATKLVKNLKGQLDQLNESGGRANFPVVVEHNMNHIGASIQKK